MNTNHLPWQDSHWQVLQRRAANHQLPHALLLVGPAGIGKKQFAERFAQSLLCETTNNNLSATPCGNCRACQLFEAGTHLDFLNIAPEAEGKAIKVDQIRALNDFVSKTAKLGHYKIILIYPADALNINAANALLKTLEEPTANTLMILITHRLMTLPATVRSRCQIIQFAAPNKALATEWLLEKGLPKKNISLLLALSYGAPLKALQLAEQNELKFRHDIFQAWVDFYQQKANLVALSTEWQALNLDRLLGHWISWISDIIHLEQLDNVDIVNRDFIGELKMIAQHKNIKQWYKYLDELNQARYYVNKPANLNAQLLIDGLLLKG